MSKILALAGKNFKIIIICIKIRGKYKQKCTRQRRLSSTSLKYTLKCGRAIPVLEDTKPGAQNSPDEVIRTPDGTDGAENGICDETGRQEIPKLWCRKKQGVGDPRSTAAPRDSHQDHPPRPNPTPRGKEWMRRGII